MDRLGIFTVMRTERTTGIMCEDKEDISHLELSMVPKVVILFPLSEFLLLFMSIYVLFNLSLVR
jgi:hypothetical protein